MSGSVVAHASTLASGNARRSKRPQLTRGAEFARMSERCCGVAWKSFSAVGSWCPLFSLLRARAPPIAGKIAEPRLAPHPLDASLEPRAHQAAASRSADPTMKRGTPAKPRHAAKVDSQFGNRMPLLEARFDTPFQYHQRRK